MRESDTKRERQNETDGERERERSTLHYIAESYCINGNLFDLLKAFERAKQERIRENDRKRESERMRKTESENENRDLALYGPCTICRISVLMILLCTDHK